MFQPTYVPIATDGQGDKRVLNFQWPQPDGSVLLTQSVIQVDSNGNPIDPTADDAWKKSVLEKLDLIATLLAELV